MEDDKNEDRNSLSGEKAKTGCDGVCLTRRKIEDCLDWTGSHEKAHQAYFRRLSDESCS